RRARRPGVGSETARAERTADVPHAERGTEDDEAMSAVTGNGTMSARGSAFPVRDLTRGATVYCGVVMALAAAVAAPLLTHIRASGDQWAAFVVFSSCAAVAQLFTVQTPRNHGFQTTNVFLIPAGRLLPAPLAALPAGVYLASLLRRALDRAHARRPRRGHRDLLAAESLAEPVRAGAARPPPPVARRPTAPGRGPRRPEDRPLQRAALRSRACRG